MLVLVRFLHIVVGTFWAGSVMFMALFLMPTSRALGPAAGPVMGHLAQVRRLTDWLLGAGLVTLLAGLVLYWRVSGGVSATWLRSGSGVTFTAGAVLAITALLIGLTQNRPTAKRLGALTAGRAATAGPLSPVEAAEVAALQRRLFMLTLINATLLAGATSAMAVARYV